MRLSAQPQGSYYATAVKDGETSVAESLDMGGASGGNMMTFKRWEATKDQELRVCMDSETNCPFKSNKGIDREDYEWKEETIEIPEGTEQVSRKC